MQTIYDEDFIAHVMEEADDRNAEILSEIFLKKK